VNPIGFASCVNILWPSDTPGLPGLAGAG